MSILYGGMRFFQSVHVRVWGDWGGGVLEGKEGQRCMKLYNRSTVVSKSNKYVI